MAQNKFSKLELQIMQALWNNGKASIREIQETFPEDGRPAYTTIQTTVYRLEGKNAVRRVKKISNAHIFEAVVSRNAAQGRLIDELLSLFGGRTQPVMAHLIESGRLTMDDVKEAEQTLRRLFEKGQTEMIPALANHLLQSTIFAAIAGILTVFLRNNHARTRYWICLAASMKFLIPFSVFVEIGHRLSWSTAPVITQPRVVLLMDEISQSFAAPDFAVTRSVHATINSPSIVPALLLALWIAGCAAVLIFWFARWRRVRAMLRAATPMCEGRELSVLRRMDADLKLISSPAQMEPGVFGIVRPVLFLPAGIEERLEDGQLNAIFAHELCHIRYRDNLTAALHMLVEAVFWFHPLVWWLGAKLVDERERACDEEVVRMGSDPELYAEAIITVCKAYLRSPLVCAAGISGSDLAKRIESIMANHFAARLSGAKKLLLGGAGLLAFIVPIAIGVLTVPAIRAQFPTPIVIAQAAQPAPLSPAPVLPSRTNPPAPLAKPPAASVPRLEFEVASLRPVGSGMGRGTTRGGPGTSDPERFSWENAYLRSLLMRAYGIRIDQVSGPSWLDSEKYTIAAKIPPGTTEEQFRIMLQNLLLDRFRMTLHFEAKEVPGYELAVAKNGPKLKDSALAANASQRHAMTPGDGLNLPVDRDGFKQLGDFKGMTTRTENGISFETYQNTSVPDFILFLAARMGTSISQNRFAPAIVVDKTGLTGEYDFTFEFALASAPMPRFNFSESGDPAEASDPLRGTDFFIALEKQLGLKLQTTRTTADVLVIDHAEKVPTEN